MSGIGCSCCNQCCMSEYVITNASTGHKAGSITCAGGGRGKRHKITFETHVDSKSKALILAAFIVIYDLYFSPCCGHIGTMGCRGLTGCIIMGFACSFFLVIIIIGLIKGGSSEPK